MGNICKIEGAIGNRTCDRTPTETGSILLKVKKVDINKSKLQDILQEYNADVKQVYIGLSSGEITYNIETVTSADETPCFEEISNMNQTMAEQVDQNNHFKFNVGSQSDIVSIKLLLPPSEYDQVLIGDQSIIPKPETIA